MTAPARCLNETEMMFLSSVMDCLVPPIDDLPGAGAMGLAPEVDSLAQQHAPYQRALTLFIKRLTPNWSVELPPSQKDALLRNLEAAEHTTFNAALDLVYLAYYGDPRVHRRVGWRGGPLQPEGFPLAPFNPAILQAVRLRKPFWRLT